jgi:DNA-binding MurR/RpiR family transcriptional regulator
MAARSALTRPQDEAPPSMREQARRAVHAARITRRAQRRGLDAHAPIRRFYAEAIRDQDLGFAGTAGIRVARLKHNAERARTADMVGRLTNEMARLSRRDAAEQLVAAAALLVFVRCIYCLGVRSGHAMSWPSFCVLLLLGERDVLPDAVAGVWRDSLCFAHLKDRPFAVSAEPSRQATIKVAPANKNGILIVVLIDGAVSSRAVVAAEMPNDGPWLFYNLTPMFAAIAPGLDVEASLVALRRTPARRAAFHVHRSQKSRAVRCPWLS